MGKTLGKQGATNWGRSVARRQGGKAARQLDGYGATGATGYRRKAASTGSSSERQRRWQSIDLAPVLLDSEGKDLDKTDLTNSLF